MNNLIDVIARVFFYVMLSFGISYNIYISAEILDMQRSCIEDKQ